MGYGKPGLIAALAALLAGCASYDGSSLVPGKSTGADIQATMGTPVERQTYPGETVWWYPRGPAGWHSYAVTVGSDGILKRIEQRLTVENVRKVVPNAWTKKEVRELFGPPGAIGQLPLMSREWWEYKYLDYQDQRVLWVQFSEDRVVREVLDMRDWAFELPGMGRSRHK